MHVQVTHRSRTCNLSNHDYEAFKGDSAMKTVLYFFLYEILKENLRASVIENHFGHLVGEHGVFTRSIVFCDMSHLSKDEIFLMRSKTV